MSKATHEGTCQLCGRQQRLPGGKLAKHGYTVEYGFFSGVCPGSHEQPYETSRNLIAKRIEWSKAHAQELRSTAAVTSSLRDKVWVEERTAPSFQRGMRHGKNEWRLLDRSEVTFVQYYGATSANWIGVDGGKRSETVRDPEAKSYYEPYDEPRAVTLMNRRRAATYSAMADKVDSYVDWLQARFDSWVFAPEKLVAVKDDAKQPLMHWYGGHWRHGKACAASAMGARSGRATSDTAAVNCSKCLAIIDRNKEKLCTEATPAS